MKKDTSWEKSSGWYNEHMKEEGGYNHKELILPNLLPLLNLNEKDRLLDLGCGQGVLARAILPSVQYLGLDASKSLIELAKSKDSNPKHDYRYHDVLEPIESKIPFSHAVFLLSLQNIAKPDLALKNASKVLKKEGQLVLVLNHPCFRIPKHSSWEVLPDYQGQYRRIDRYFNPFKSSIQMHPSKGEKSPLTWSFHWPLSQYMRDLKAAGFFIEDMLEICSKKKSYGKAARAENFIRKEIPLFLMISARKMKSFD